MSTKSRRGQEVVEAGGGIFISQRFDQPRGENKPNTDDVQPQGRSSRDFLPANRARSLAERKREVLSVNKRISDRRLVKDGGQVQVRTTARGTAHTDTGNLNMETGTIIPILTLLAIATTPITSVFVTRRIDYRREARNRQVEVFRTLMRTRRVPMSADHVGALNLIEIEFANDAGIVAAWRDLSKHLHADHARRADEQVMVMTTGGKNRRFDPFDKRICEERERLRSKLLHAIGAKLGFKIEQLDIFEGGYIPQGWEDEYVEQQLVRRFLLDLYAGRVALPVMAVEPPPLPHSGPELGDGKPQ